eukprot:15093689-Alexandrium_andersonii.AAC.1
MARVCESDWGRFSADRHLSHRGSDGRGTRLMSACAAVLTGIAGCPLGSTILQANLKGASGGALSLHPSLACRTHWPNRPL